ncbi:unnamed protein product [Brassica oleracea]
MDKWTCMGTHILSTSHTQPYFFVLLFKTGITNEQHTLPPS